MYNAYLAQNNETYIQMLKHLISYRYLHTTDISMQLQSVIQNKIPIFIQFTKTILTCHEIIRNQSNIINENSYQNFRITNNNIKRRDITLRKCIQQF